MIPEKSNITIERSQNFRESAIILKPSARIMKILRSGIYTDKILAPLREYSANAYDAHVEVGKRDVPIHVQLPSLLNPTLIIRDFGKGLNDNDIRNVFGAYGESTKDGNNDQIGMMGIGSKSFMAYCQSMMVTSFHNGYKSVYTMYIDESEIGSIALLSCDPTEEESGIQIDIPVQQDDIPFFIEKAQYLFQFWNPHPKITGNPSYKKVEHEYSLQGKGYKFPKNTSTALVVMGGIPYTMSYYSLNMANENLASIIDARVVLEANIGDVSIASSREQLEYNDKTRNWLLQRLEEISKDIQKDFDDRTKNITSEYSARKLFYDYFNQQGALYNYMNSLVANKVILFNGKPIDGAYIKAPFYTMDIRYVRRSRRAAKRHLDIMSSNPSSELDIHKNSKNFYYWVDNDIDFSETKFKKLLRWHFDHSIGYVPLIVVKFKSEQEYTDWANSIGFPLDTFKNIRVAVQIPPKPPKVRAPRAPRVKNPYIPAFYHNKDKWVNEPLDLTKTTGYYVERRYGSCYFKLRNGNKIQITVRDIETIRTVFNFCGNTTNIFVLDPPDVKRIHKRKGWSPIEDDAYMYLTLALNEPLSVTWENIESKFSINQRRLIRELVSALEKGLIDDELSKKQLTFTPYISKLPYMKPLYDLLGILEYYKKESSKEAKINEKCDDIKNFIKRFPLIRNISNADLNINLLGEKELIFYIQSKMAKENEKMLDLAVPTT